MLSPLRTVEEATPDRLSALLGRRVTSVSTKSSNTSNSVIAHRELHFDDSQHATMKLLLKLNHDSEGREEVTFYDLVTKTGTDTSVLAPCMNAAFDPVSGTSHLLLLDVSETHESPVTRESLLALEGVPSEARLSAVTEALARFHAAFWKHTLLDKHPATQLIDRYRDEAAFGAWWAKHRQDYEQFDKVHRHNVPAEVHALLQGALTSYPKLWKRYIEPRSQTLAGLTVTHNDCYLTQFLCSKSGQGETYLVDFQSSCTDFAAHDLVYLMATFWTREQRRVHERGVLEHYHRTLLECGVHDYSLEQLFEDYRLTLIDMIFHPVWDTTYGADPEYWRPKLKCLTDAYQDWQCDELFRS